MVLSCRTNHSVSLRCAWEQKAEEEGACCCRYTSYGRHFTEAGHLEALNEFLLPYLQHQDTIVDFSCGANVWVPMLKTACLQQGIVRPPAPCGHISHTSLHDLSQPCRAGCRVRQCGTSLLRCLQEQFSLHRAFTLCTHGRCTAGIPEGTGGPLLNR